jgi:hypothetical protein
VRGCCRSSRRHPQRLRLTPSGADIPQPLRELVAARKGVILRYAASVPSFGYLRRYYADDPNPADFDVSGTATGVGENEIPKYLLIWGGPSKIPWRAQYALNMTRCVGRLDLDGGALKNYVDHLLSDWSGITCNPLAPVVWSANYGPEDITALMQSVIADALWRKFQADTDLSAGALRFKDDRATREALAAACAAKPGLIVMTSHGMTGPQAQTGSYKAQLGAPLDANHALLDTDALPNDVIPGGAVWYSHACCSAGSDSQSQCADLFPVGNGVGDTLRSVSCHAGDMVSPLATKLLGATKPVRAFIGHVEPTFDWTLRNPNTGQALGDAFVKAFYEQLYQKGMPIGLALNEIYKRAGGFLTNWRQALEAVNKNQPGAAEQARYEQIAALDRQGMVILGDPVVSLPL